MANDEANDRRPLPDPDPRVQFQLGSMLRQVYGTVITEPVPDRFSALLNQLASAPQTGADRLPQAADDISSAKTSLSPVDKQDEGKNGERT